MITGITAKNAKKKFSPAEKAVVKDKYVYALQDPRDNKAFYVGQGTGGRVFSHFAEAEKFLKGDGEHPSSKILRILDIWAQDEDVKWYIIAHGLSDGEADRVEAAVIDAFTNSQNGTPLNEISGIHSTLLLNDDITAGAAEPVSPSRPCTVFVFSVQNQLATGLSPYEATRSKWQVSEKNRQLDAYAVGLKYGISAGAFKIDKWTPAGGEKFEFTKTGDTGDALIAELEHKNWRPVINPALGYIQYGQYLIVEFNGKGKYRIVRGDGPNPDWRQC